MKNPMHDIDAFNAVNPKTVRKYLEHQGWSKRADFSDKADIWAYTHPEGKRFEVLLPTTTDIPDYASRMDDVFRVLELLEQRSKSELFNDLVDVRAIAADRGREILNLHFQFGSEAQNFAEEIGASAKHLGAILESLQTLFNSIGQVKAGRPTPYGKVAKDITDQTQLSVVSLFKGSFGVRLAVAPQKEQLDLIGEPLAEAVIQEFFELLRASHGVEQHGLSNQLKELQKRTTSNYRKFLLSLADAEANLSVDWGSLNPHRGGSVAIDSTDAFRVVEIIRELEPEEPKEYEIIGELLAINQPSQTFLIRSIKDDTSFSGKIAPELINREFIIPKVYEVTIRENISSSTLTEAIKVDHTLVDIRPWHPEDT